MNCPDCGSPVERDAPFCPKCYARIEPPTFWRKLLSLFQSVGKLRSPVVNIKRTFTINTKDKDGQRHEYHSLEEAPPEVRDEIEKLESEMEKEAFTASASDGLTKKFITKKTISVFRVKDASGTERTYHSLDELPPEIRAALEKAQKELEQ